LFLKINHLPPTLFGTFPSKITLLAALSSVVLWASHAAGSSPEAEPGQAGSVDPGVIEIVAEGARLRIPVEVVSKGSAPEWVYVEVENQAVPEPGILPLLLLPTLLLLRRRHRGT
jgi:hypothetical protein